jgi:hypothetical protein
MVEDSGEVGVYRIERGAARVPGHACGYDRYTRVRLFATLAAALKAVRTCA